MWRLLYYVATGLLVSLVFFSTGAFGATPTATPTRTPYNYNPGTTTPTRTWTRTPTRTPTKTPTSTWTLSVTATETETPTETPTPTETETPTTTQTSTTTATPTKTPTQTQTPTVTNTPTVTPVYVNPNKPSWRYSCGAFSTISTPTTGFRYFTMKGSASKIVAINRIRAGVVVSAAAANNWSATTAQSEVQISICAPDTTPGFNSGVSIQKLDELSPTSSCAATINGSQPGVLGAVISDLAFYAFVNIIPANMGAAPMTLIGTEVAGGVTLTSSGNRPINQPYGAASIIFDDQNGTAPLILRNASENLCLSNVGGLGNYSNFVFSVEWTEF
jgi:hypothetical protein